MEDYKPVDNEEKHPIVENIEFLIAKKSIECKLILYEHPRHKNEVVLEWKIDPTFRPSFIRISKLAIPELIRRLKEHEK